MPQRGNLPILLTDILSGLYCTFFVGAGAFLVVPKLELHLQRLGDLCRQV